MEANRPYLDICSETSLIVYSNTSESHEQTIKDIIKNVAFCATITDNVERNRTQ